MKIGIITTYDELNFGAFLQAYSLQQYLTSLGFYSEFINYKSTKYFLYELKATYCTKAISNLIKQIKKSIKFKTLLRNNMNISKKYRNIDKINKAGYDIIIFGSDEIWNIKNCIGVVDPYYFGVGIKSKKIAYAVSFGSTSIEDQIPEIFVKSFKEFSFISVRDENSYNILQKFGIPSVIVVDPTFLIEHKEVNIKLPEREYICLYGHFSDQFIKEVISFAKDKNLEIISVGYKNKFFTSIIDINPFEWLSYIKNAKYVATSMFHGTIFSIKFNKPFVTFVSLYRANKLISLLKTFELEDRVYRQGELSFILNKPIEWSIVMEKITLALNCSTDFLKKAIQNA